MTTPTELRAAVEAAVANLPESERRDDAGSAVTWARAGTTFATLRPDGVEIRVGATIAAAAARTPDARIGDTGPDWVAFNPTALDGHALDRLRAWLEAAHRRAS